MPAIVADSGLIRNPLPCSADLPFGEISGHLRWRPPIAPFPLNWNKRVCNKGNFGGGSYFEGSADACGAGRVCGSRRFRPHAAA